MRASPNDARIGSSFGTMCSWAGSGASPPLPHDALLDASPDAFDARASARDARLGQTTAIYPSVSDVPLGLRGRRHACVPPEPPAAKDGPRWSTHRPAHQTTANTWTRLAQRLLESSRKTSEDAMYFLIKLNGAATVSLFGRLFSREKSKSHPTPASAPDKETEATAPAAP